mmetsp:Transcript_8517/g.10773  ORF Transcript_8517/g.10773 Transcript_8517/m.10773 type:complete len:368 (-) Transcript_8517:524-1627(-)
MIGLPPLRRLNILNILLLLSARLRVTNGFAPPKQIDANINQLQNVKHVFSSKKLHEENRIVSTPMRGGGILSAWPDPKSFSPDYQVDTYRIAVTIACTFFTWFAQRQYTNVMASSALTLICSMCFDKHLGQAAFCGTFAGMGSFALVPTWQYALSLGALTSLLFEILIHQKNYCLGIGGRLGATAFISSSIIAAVQGISPGVSLSSLTLDNLQKGTIISMAIWHAVGSVATIVLREVGDDSTAADPVRASAVIGLIAALLVEDKSAALAIYGGSFVGMSLPSRLIHGILPGKLKEGSKVPSISLVGLLASFAVSGLFGGILHGVTIGLDWWSGGWGGKAGFCAFLGCLIFRGMRKVTGGSVAAAVAA